MSVCECVLVSAGYCKYLYVCVCLCVFVFVLCLCVCVYMGVFIAKATGKD